MYIIDIIKEDLHDYGIFFVLIFIPLFSIMLICELLYYSLLYPFKLFNDWSKTWFQND